MSDSSLIHKDVMDPGSGTKSKATQKRAKA